MITRVVFAGKRRPQTMAGVKIDQAVGAFLRVPGVNGREAAEEAVEFPVDNMQQMASFLGTGRISKIVEQRQ